MLGILEVTPENFKKIQQETDFRHQAADQFNKVRFQYGVIAWEKTYDLTEKSPLVHKIVLLEDKRSYCFVNLRTANQANVEKALERPDHLLGDQKTNWQQYYSGDFDLFLHYEKNYSIPDNNKHLVHRM